VTHSTILILSISSEYQLWPNDITHEIKARNDKITWCWEPT